MIIRSVCTTAVLVFAACYFPRPLIQEEPSTAVEKQPPNSSTASKLPTSNIVLYKSGVT